MPPEISPPRPPERRKYPSSPATGEAPDAAIAVEGEEDAGLFQAELDALFD